MFTICCVVAAVVSMDLALAWKFLWAVIKFTNSSVISTLDLSSEPERIVPKPSDPASPTVAVPETAVSTYVALPICFRPFWLLKFANTILPNGLFCPFV